MLLSSFIGRIVGLSRGSLAKHAKSNSASLRHITAPVKVSTYQPQLASSVQSTKFQSLCTRTQPTSHQTNKSRHSSEIMSNDAYSSFLDQANQDTGSSKVSAKSKPAATKAVDTDVPVTLQKVDQYYTSESDEPFEPVSLKWSGKNMPSESMKLQQTHFISKRHEIVLMTTS